MAAILAAGWLSLVVTGAQASSPLGPAPVLESISPWVVAPGDVVTISGQHLGDDLLGCGSLLGGFPSVHFVGLDGSGDHVVQVTDAANCNNPSLQVAVPSGFSGGATVFTQDPSSPPKVSNKNFQVTVQPTGSVTPTSGAAGTQAAIVGGNLKPPTIAPNPVLQVFVDGAQQAPTAWSAGSIAFAPRSGGAVQAGFLVSTDGLDPANPAKLARVIVNAGSYTYVAAPAPPPPGSGPSRWPVAPGAVDSLSAPGGPGVAPRGPGPLPFGTFAGDFPVLSDSTLGGSSGGLSAPAPLVDRDHQVHKPAKAPSPVQLSLVANPHMPLVALGLLAVGLLAIGVWMNLRPVRSAAG